MDATTYIYGLIDPVDGSLRYVGKTHRPAIRLNAHLGDARRGVRRHSARWIRGLLSLGLTPEMMILEGVPTEEWKDAERFWIAYLRSIGCPLTNHCDGGQGVTGADQITRQKISLGLKGRKCPWTDVPALIARNQSPSFWTPERRAASAKAQRARFQCDGPPNLGHPVSDKMRQAVAAANATRAHSPETRSKLTEATRRRNELYGLPDTRKRYTATAPDGTIHQVHGLSAFCREHGLDVPTMVNVAKGKCRQHKGWTCAPVL